MLEAEHDLRLRATATLDECKRRGIDPAKVYGDRLNDVRQLVKSDAPSWLDPLPDTVTKLQAKGDVDDWVVTQDSTLVPL